MKSLFSLCFCKFSLNELVATKTSFFRKIFSNQIIFNNLSGEKKVLTKFGVRNKDVWTGVKTPQRHVFRTLSTFLRRSFITFFPKEGILNHGDSALILKLNHEIAKFLQKLTLNLSKKDFLLILHRNCSLIATCKANKINPFEYLKDVLNRINSHSHKRLAELLPHNWKPIQK